MKKILFLLLILSIISCGKDEGQTNPYISTPIKNSRTIVHDFPYFHVEKIQNVRLSLEGGTEKMELPSYSEHKGRRDFVRKSLLISLDKGLEKNNFEFNFKHREFLLYYTKLYSQIEYLENRELLKSLDLKRYHSGSLKLDISFQARNLNNVHKISKMFVDVFFIDIKSWSKKHLTRKRLTRFGQDPDIIFPNGATNYTPRKAHRLTIEDLDITFLEKIIKGEILLAYQLGAGEIELKGGELYPNPIFSYEDIIAEYFKGKKFVYIQNGKSLQQIIRKDNESLVEVLQKFDPLVETSLNGDIFYFNGVESTVSHHTSREQLLEKASHGYWKKIENNNGEISLVSFISSEMMKSLEVYKNDIETNFLNMNGIRLNDLEGPQFERKYVLISDGHFITPLFETRNKRKFSKIDEPKICSRNFDRYDYKRECLYKDLSCYFTEQFQKGVQNREFSEKDFQEFLNIQKEHKQSIVKQWYSNRLKKYFIVFNKSPSVRDIELSEKLFRVLGTFNKGVINFGHCPSRNERGFSIPGENYPAGKVKAVEEPVINMTIESHQILNEI